MRRLNFKHLHYFWMVAKGGSITKAGELLHITPQTISAQLSQLEEDLGYPLFQHKGRFLDLTDAGRLVLSYVDKIFTLGDELEEVLRTRRRNQISFLRVGISNAVPKTIAYRLLEPFLAQASRLHIVCREEKFINLLGDLAVQKLDLVISDAPIPATARVRGFNHLLGECGLTFLATPGLAAQLAGPFPRNLEQAPMLLPGEDAAIRVKLIHWLENKGVHPVIIGEFDDGALMKEFGHAGAGVFMVPTVVGAEVIQRYNVVPIGYCNTVVEQFYAISAERQPTHDAVRAICETARQKLFNIATKPAKKSVRRRPLG